MCARHPSGAGGWCEYSGGGAVTNGSRGVAGSGQARLLSRVTRAGNTTPTIDRTPGHQKSQHKKLEASHFISAKQANLLKKHNSEQPSTISTFALV